MKLKHQISFNNVTEIERKISQMGLNFKLVDGLVGRLVQLTIYNHDHRWLELKKVLSDFEIEYITFTEFEKRDYHEAEWYLLEAREAAFPEPQENFNFLNITYDLKDFCENCGVGAVQKEPFKIKGTPKQKLDVFCLNWVFDEVFIKENVKITLQEMNISGGIFNPVIHSKLGQPIEELYQLKVDSILEGGLNPYNCTLEECNHHQTKATSIKYNRPLIGGLTFNEDIFPKDKDIVKTDEWFGSGKESHRLILCSKKIFSTAMNERWKGLKLSPIFHEKAFFENI
jgi:hypothetical protein